MVAGADPSPGLAYGAAIFSPALPRGAATRRSAGAGRTQRRVPQPGPPGPAWPRPRTPGSRRPARPEADTLWLPGSMPARGGGCLWARRGRGPRPPREWACGRPPVKGGRCWAKPRGCLSLPGRPGCSASPVLSGRPGVWARLSQDAEIAKKATRLWLLTLPSHSCSPPSPRAGQLVGFLSS